MRARNFALLFWWFLLLGEHPVVVGPFYDVSECDAINAQTSDYASSTSCWSDVFEPKNTLRK